MMISTQHLHAGMTRKARGQRGAIAIMMALMLVVIVCFCGMAFDVGQMTNRNTELQGLADAVAIAAAKELDGTAAGIGNALGKAASVAASWKYQHNSEPVTWNNSALTFGNAADGEWRDAGAAAAAPNGLLYAKVDTAALAASHGNVDLTFMPMLAGNASSVQLAAVAVAGRLTINVTPMAVCALSNLPAAPRANAGAVELVEFGFRRGISYDLMQLNPNGTTPVNYAVDPYAIPGTAGTPANVTPAALGPFVCSGKMAMPRVTGGTITVSSPFPLGALFQHLNSRFGQYEGGACSPEGAPPDKNVKAYTPAAVTWMGTTPGPKAEQAPASTGKAWTIADPFPALGTNTAAMYGPLWLYARAVPFSAYVAGANEPANGYRSFQTTDWSTLYNPGKPSATKAYPSASVPYKAGTATAYSQDPPLAYQPGLANRRVLNVPLLSCPVGGAAANVLGIGKFFMTVPATETSLVAEFAGVAPEQSLGGSVELVR